MELARAIKRIGDPVTLANVQHYTSARMYRNAAQVWEGYKKIFLSVQDAVLY